MARRTRPVFDRRLFVQRLEDRTVPATFTVTNIADAGIGSGASGDLRYCITQSNATAGPNTIDASGVNGSIYLQAALPSITQRLSIVGPGASLLTVNGQGLGSVFNVTTAGSFGVSNLTISGGSTSHAGGGISNFPAGIPVTVTVANSVVSGNTAASSGGGIAVYGGTLVIRNSTISDNTAGFNGGGMIFQGRSSALVISNSTIANNTSQNGGGILATFPSGTVGATIVSSTITANRAAGGSGGGINTYSYPNVPPLSLDNAIVSGNAANFAGPDIYSSGPGIVAAGYSALGTGTGYTLLDQGHNLTGAAATPASLGLTGLVGVAVPNTNPAQSIPVIVLGPGSTAIGAGDPAQNGMTDERGVLRPQQSGANPQPDIGAFERLPGPSAVATAASVTSPGGTVYTFTVTFSDTVPVNTATFGPGNVAVSGALSGGGTVNPTVAYVGVDASDPNNVIATYQFTPPSGSWIAADNGTYTVTMRPNQVMAANGVVPAGFIGSFVAGLPETILVSTAADGGPGSLRDAITHSNANLGADTIIFDPAVFAVAQTISLSSALPIVTDAATLAGPGSGLLTVQRDPSATSDFAVLNLNARGRQSFSISGLTVSGGTRSGVNVTDEMVTLTDVTVTASSASDGSPGGGITGGGGSLTILNCSILNNSVSNPASIGGGGIGYSGTLDVESSSVSSNTLTTNSTGRSYAEAGGVGYAGPANTSLTIRNSTIFNNTGVLGGGVGISLASSTALIADTTIVQNAAVVGVQYSLEIGNGGGIAVIGGTATVQDSQVTDNSAVNSGGGVFAGGRVSLRGCSVTTNATSFGAFRFGGGVYVTGSLTAEGSAISNNQGDCGVFVENSGVLSVQNCDVSANATRGIFISQASSPVDIEDCTITDNADGGIYAMADNALTIRGCTITGNTAIYGGGIYAGGSLLVENCTIAGNTSTGQDYYRTIPAKYGGGGIFWNGTQATIRNSTITGNSAASNGGGIDICSGTLVVQNCTITANTAASPENRSGTGGGGIVVVNAGYGDGPASVLLQSTIVAGNVGANGRPDLAMRDTTASMTADHSLIGAADTVALSMSSTNNFTGTVAAPLDPRLASLGDNGGLTQTCALFAGSPALNAGSNPAGLAADQRGISRSIGPAPDIGAYEYQPITVAGVQVNDGSAQRSEVRSITISFSGSVGFAGGTANAAAAFRLTHVQTGNAVTLAAAVSTTAAGQTAVTLTFSGGETDPVSGLNGALPSLADGRYALTVLGGSVSDAHLGWTFDGNGDGAPGGDYASPADTYHGTGLHLYRLFGDASGDGVVDATDLGQLRSAFNTGVGNPRYLSYLDADNSGAVDASDLGQFRSRFNANVF